MAFLSRASSRWLAEWRALLEELQDQACIGLAEIASIYQTEEERLMNKPRRQAVPNPTLEVDMARYRLKIEKKFSESFMNHNFSMPRLPPKPLKIRYSGGLTMLDVETVKLITQRSSSQIEH